MSNANFSKKILCSWHLFLLPILFEPRILGMKGKSCILPLLLSFWKVNLLFKHEVFLFFSNNKLKKAFQHLMTQLFSLESYPNITGLAPDLLVPSFQIAKTDCMCFYMLGLNDFRTVLCDKLTGINKYCNIWNGTKPWVAELASFLFFRFLFFVTCFEFGDKKKKKTYLSCWVIKCPSSPHTLLSLDGDHSPAVPLAVGTRTSFPAGASGWLAGSRGSCVLAASTEPVLCWGHAAGTAVLRGATAAEWPWTSAKPRGDLCMLSVNVCLCFLPKSQGGL